MKLKIPELVIEGEIVDEQPLPSEIEPGQVFAPLPPNGFLWLIAAAAGVGFILGAALNEGSTPKQTKAPTTRRRTRRRQE